MLRGSGGFSVLRLVHLHQYKMSQMRDSLSAPEEPILADDWYDNAKAYQASP
jgi:hypothetical protein